MNKGAKITITVVIVLVVAGLIYWYVSMQGSSYSAPTSYQTSSSTAVASPSMPMDMNMSSTPSATPISTSTPVPAPTPSPSAAAVTISNFAFTPATITIHKGTTVTWTNQDSIAHTVTGDNGGPSSGDISQGATYSYTFNTVGSFPYHCSIHPYMKGTVTVVN